MIFRQKRLKQEQASLTKKKNNVKTPMIKQGMREIFPDALFLAEKTGIKRNVTLTKRLY